MRASAFLLHYYPLESTSQREAERNPTAYQFNTHTTTGSAENSTVRQRCLNGKTVCAFVLDKQPTYFLVYVIISPYAISNNVITYDRFCELLLAQKNKFSSKN